MVIWLLTELLLLRAHAAAADCKYMHAIVTSEINRSPPLYGRYYGVLWGVQWIIVHCSVTTSSALDFLGTHSQNVNKVSMHSSEHSKNWW